MENNILELKHISKSFGSVHANHDVSLSLKKGEILSLLGENGSGKTSLMNIVSGIYYPDEGQVFVNGEEVSIKSPIDAFSHHIGMIHQHFKLIDVLSGTDNILLGEKSKFSFKNTYQQYLDAFKKDKKRMKFILKVMALPFVAFGKWVAFNHLEKNRGQRIEGYAFKYGFDIDLRKKISDLSVSERQTIEILKVLYRGADILILDEPTAVLAPQEIQTLFNVLRTMKKNGKSIIIITHKLNEVMDISDRVAVLRKGELVDVIDTKDATPELLTEMMVGEKTKLDIERSEPVNPQPALKVEGLNAFDIYNRQVLKDVSFEAKTGEILGIAGIAGSGQKELLEAIAGLQKISSGDIIYFNADEGYVPVDLQKRSPEQIQNLGVRLSFVPEDRLGMGLVGDMSITQNMLLRYYKKGKSTFVDTKTSDKYADQIIQELTVVAENKNEQVKKLSGGNVQKILVGREISSAPKVLMVAYPVRGLDINSSYLIYNLLNEQKKKGVSIIYVGEDLDVLLDLADRILVLNDGKVAGIVDARTTTKQEVGALMVGE